MSAAVFAPFGRLVAGKRSASFNALMSRLVYGRLICDAEVEFDPRDTRPDLILMLPKTGLLPLSADLLAPLVNCLDTGGFVTVRSRNLSEIDEAAKQILTMVGGGCA
ncbi:hypothetical protein ACELLULO517_27340 [Acidisoma cellulosilytica]|uniref:Uncharacterized protein n=1 Tax=Acidisoma cellulosilyticum TaxID=2802395 RepID=A0A963Z6W7_9PROT|nr:hypothetical protein [Acidisoma cellulosilyticum]MCB8883984.1 hypothetical protein [Acidisoma cellulosilyticum]